MDKAPRIRPPTEVLRAELRAVATLSNVGLITALLSCNCQLASVGLQLTF